jgi:hypothetical protein
MGKNAQAERTARRKAKWEAKQAKWEAKYDAKARKTEARQNPANVAERQKTWRELGGSVAAYWNQQSMLAMQQAGEYFGVNPENTNTGAVVPVDPRYGGDAPDDGAFSLISPPVLIGGAALALILFLKFIRRPAQ